MLSLGGNLPHKKTSGVFSLMQKKMLLSSFLSKISVFLKLLLPYFNAFPPQNQGFVCAGWED